MELPKTTLEKLLEHTPLVFLIIGAIFIAAAATGGSASLHVVVSDPVWRVVLAAFAVVLIGMAAWFAARESKGAGPATLDAARESKSAGPTRRDCETYEIRIIDARQEAEPRPSVTISGHCRDLPEGLELWVFGVYGSGKAAEYWPHGPAVFKEDKIWTVRWPLVNWKPDDLRRYQVFVVGQNGQALINCYLSVARALSPTGDRPWPGLAAAQVTSDIIPCGPIKEITLKR